MERRARIWTIGALAGLFSIASTVLNVVFASNLDHNTALTVQRILLFVAFAISLVSLACLAYFSTSYVNNLNSHALGSRTNAGWWLTGGATVAVTSVSISGVVLIWLAIRQRDLPNEVMHASTTTLLGVWFGMWGAAAAFQTVLYCLLGLWTRDVLKTRRASRLDLDFGIRIPSMSTARRPETQNTNQSFASEELTLASPPRTPVSRGGSITRTSSATKIGTGSSRKMVRYSNRSSFEAVPFPAGEAMSIDSAFDNWDTSSVHHEMRAVIHSSPPVTRSGLATIPGSRPESPADALDGPFLPESPISSSPPHAATSETPTVVGWSSSPRAPKSSPPSSPVNFSRPTSRPTSSHNNAPVPKIEKFELTRPELIHPLFRPNSPHPPPIITSGTVVTASPLADQTITPNTLARLRDNAGSGAGHWKDMPSIDRSEAENSVPDSPTLGSPSLGSPGPSIVDEAELPPILPSFVLSAGTRSSLVDYDKRKTVKKDRPRSQLSMAGSLPGNVI